MTVWQGAGCCEGGCGAWCDGLVWFVSAAGGLLHRGRGDQQQQLAMQQQQQLAAQLQQQLAAQQLLTEQRPQQRKSQDGAPAPILMSTSMSASGEAIKFEDLELRRVIGTGQFGLVRVVRHVPTNAVYALKVGRQAYGLIT